MKWKQIQWKAEVIRSVFAQEILRHFEKFGSCTRLQERFRFVSPSAVCQVSQFLSFN